MHGVAPSMARATRIRVDTYREKFGCSEGNGTKWTCAKYTPRRKIGKTYGPVCSRPQFEPWAGKARGSVSHAGARISVDNSGVYSDTCPMRARSASRATSCGGMLLSR